MPFKEAKCYRLLQRYGVLVSYSGTSTEHSKKSKNKDETFGKWRKRVLGMAVDDVVLYMPAYDIAPQTRMRTLRPNGCGGHLMGIFNVFRRLMGKSHEEAVSTREKELTEAVSTIPRTLRTRVVRGEKDDIEPSVKELSSENQR